jgi:hypothetical protein
VQTVYKKQLFCETVVITVLLAGLFTGIITVKTIIQGKKNWEIAEHNFDNHKPVEIVAMHYENVAKAYVPGSPYPEMALWKLRIMARSARMKGNTAEALYLWEVIRRSVLSTRHVTLPNKQYLQAADRSIAKLRFSKKNDKNELKMLQNQPDDPNPWLSLLLFAGIILWIGGSIVSILNFKRKQWKTFYKMAPILSAGGVILWIIMAFLA